MLDHIHLNAKVTSRKVYSNGKFTNAVRSAAYRHKTKMGGLSYFTGEKNTFDFSHLSEEFVDSFFVMNDDIKKSLFNNEKDSVGLFELVIRNLKADKDHTNKEKKAMLSEALWTMVEQTEKRKDSQLFREVEVSLYHELSLKENKKLLENFIKDNFSSKGMIADVAIHRSSSGNLHAHIMLTMRDFNCQLCCFGKKNRDWNNLNLVDEWRENWAKLSSQALNREIYHKSYRRMAYEALEHGDARKANHFMALDSQKANHIAKSETEELKNRRFAMSQKIEKKALDLMNEYENIAQISREKASKVDELINLTNYELLNLTTQKRVFGGFYRDGKSDKIKKLRETLRQAREKIKSEFKQALTKLQETINLTHKPLADEISLALSAEKPFGSLNSKKLGRR